MRQRRLVAAVLVILLLGGGAFAAFTLLSDSDDDNEQPEATTTSTTSQPAVDPVSPVADEELEEFSWGQTLLRLERQGEGDQGNGLQVYFLSEGSEVEIAADAVSCTDEFLAEGYAAVSCYGFDSEEAFEAAAPDPATGGMAKLCWRAFYSTSVDSEGTGGKAGEQYDAEGCP